MIQGCGVSVKDWVELAEISNLVKDSEGAGLRKGGRLVLAREKEKSNTLS